MTALILGVVGLFIPGVGVAAILVGRRDPDPTARAGVILGWVGTGLTVLGCCIGSIVGVLPALSGFGSDSGPAVAPTVPTAAPMPTRPAPTAPVAPTAEPAKRGYLGIQCEDDGGARVTAVLPDSPAERAGIQAGDVITRVGEQFVPYCSDLAREIASRPGQTVRLSVFRNGETAEVMVTLGEQ